MATSFSQSNAISGHPTPAALALAERWLAVLRLGEYAPQRLGAVPASVQRLCLVARALIKCPPLLLLDEPAQGLDAGQLAHFRAVLEAICAATDVALIYVSHLPSELPAAVTRVLRLAPGGTASAEQAPGGSTVDSASPRV